ncbi:unnamed protein product [Ambrosiozyma monospora]|uniref:Unnamed protein product n=1 Tax=Ambrosiozyma monospora TaxID=43982 RepID=A0ACB5SZF7_AMBMO|nr:unnamed protein product [Ambrosiozyma monospora]
MSLLLNPVVGESSSMPLVFEPSGVTVSLPPFGAGSSGMINEVAGVFESSSTVQSCVAGLSRHAGSVPFGAGSSSVINGVAGVFDSSGTIPFGVQSSDVAGLSRPAGSIPFGVQSPGVAVNGVAGESISSSFMPFQSNVVLNYTADGSSFVNWVPAGIRTGSSIHVPIDVDSYTVNNGPVGTSEISVAEPPVVNKRKRKLPHKNKNTQTGSGKKKKKRKVNPPQAAPTPDPVDDLFNFNYR